MTMADERLRWLARHCVNLADASLGAQCLYATDEFFAPSERMLNPAPPVFMAGKFDEHGKWMDGWETRRRREAGFDYCIVRLGMPGSLRAIELDTTFFTGNYAPVASVDACFGDSAPGTDTPWREIVAPTSLRGDGSNLLEVEAREVWTHLKLNIFPDGGIARLRVYGDVSHDWTAEDASALVDLVALEHGGRALECSDEHYGAISNLIKPGRGTDMGDGWETRRRREPGFDWVILKLGHAGEVRQIEIDTAHFKGNFPHRIEIQAAHLPGDCDEHLAARSLYWLSLLPAQRLAGDRRHHFESELERRGPVTHVRVDIHPDGGLSRVRLLGHLTV